MEVGEVRAAKDSDFTRLLELATESSTDDDGWELAATKSYCSVYTRTTDSCNFKMVKVVADVPDIAADTIYNALHDIKYRKVWDKLIVENEQICVIDAQNDIGYHQVRTPIPLSNTNRDFVTQRSWQVSNGLYMKMNHSVYHKAQPPRKNIVRAISYCTGCVIESTGENSSRYTYINQSNPCGIFPAWLINQLITVVTPKSTQRMLEACRGYKSWKKGNDPDYMPWIWPNQITTPLLDWNDVMNTGQRDVSNCSEELEDLQTSEVTDTIVDEGDD